MPSLLRDPKESLKDMLHFISISLKHRAIRLQSTDKDKAIDDQDVQDFMSEYTAIKEAAAEVYARYQSDTDLTMFALEHEVEAESLWKEVFPSSDSYEELMNRIVPE